MSIASTSERKSQQPTIRGAITERLERGARSAVLSLLARFEGESVVLREAGEEYHFGDPGGVPITVLVHRPRVYRRILEEGSIGAGRAWIEGDWNCDDLPGLLRLFAAQNGFIGPRGRMDSPIARAASLLRRITSPLTRNTRAGSRRNIAAHYDLGNEFYRAMLDPSMTYSSALFSFEGEPLESAQAGKYDRLCRQLELRPVHRVLEIGSGWGGFAMYAAKHYGCHVTTTTISEEQEEFVRERVERAGLSDRIEILRKDYRDLSGLFDRLVSIEMVEAVGAQYLETFMRVCSDRLYADGVMGLQAIVIADQLYDRSRTHVDFIKRYVFPGGFLPSIAALSDCVGRVTDFGIRDVHDLTADYAETLRRWRFNLEDEPDAYAKVSTRPEFERLWTYYLAYCEAGFEERRIACVQMTLAKSGWRP